MKLFEAINDPDSLTRFIGFQKNLLFILGNMGAVGSNAANGNVSSGSMILGGPQGASGVNLRGGMGKIFLEFPVLL